MVGDVNIFLTDPTDPSLAELEIMIAGDAQRLTCALVFTCQNHFPHICLFQHHFLAVVFLIP